MSHPPYAKPSVPVPILTGTTNYTLWRNAISTALLVGQVARHASGSRPRPVAPAADDVDAAAILRDIRDWENADDKALGIILQSLSPSVSLATNKANPFTVRTSASVLAWITATYGNPGSVGTVTALSTIMHTPAPVNTDPGPWLERINGAWDDFIRSLPGDGELTKELMHTSLLLAALPASSPLAHRLRERGDTVSVADISAALHEDWARAQHDRSRAAANHALVAAPPARSPPAPISTRPSRPARTGRRAGLECSLHGPDSTHVSSDCSVLAALRKAGKQIVPIAATSASGSAPVALASSAPTIPPTDSMDVSTVFADAFHAAALHASIAGDALVLDSGATDHMVDNRSTLRHIRPRFGPGVRVGGGVILPSSEKGDLTIDTARGPFLLTDTIYVPGLGVNLLSIRRLQASGLRVEFAPDSNSAIVTRGNDVLLSAPVRDGLYIVDGSMLPPGAPSSPAALPVTSTAPADPDLVAVWHDRLGHLNVQALAKLARDGKLGKGVSFTRSALDAHECSSCILGKGKRLPSRRSATSASAPGDRTNLDLWGPARTPTPSGARYLLVAQDDHSRKVFVYFLAQKSDALTRIKEHVALVRTQLGVTTKREQAVPAPL
jgi:hypothetical protein